MRELKRLDLSEAFWQDIRRLRAIRRGLDAKRDASEELTNERLTIWIRLHSTLSFREIGAISDVGHSFVKRELDKETEK
jgi:hypothetical protein